MGILSLGSITGAGGKEAALFTAEVFHMYQNYSAFRQWEFEVLSVDTSDGGGYRVRNLERERGEKHACTHVHSIHLSVYAHAHTHTHSIHLLVYAHTHAHTHTQHTHTHTHTMKRN